MPKGIRIKESISECDANQDDDFDDKLKCEHQGAFAFGNFYLNASAASNRSLPRWRSFSNYFRSLPFTPRPPVDSDADRAMLDLPKPRYQTRFDA